MTLVEWREEFRIGIPGVDHEHEQLIGMINGLHGALHGSPSMTALDFLGELDAQIAAHFALEEREMRERGYPRYAGHKADHERLIDDIGDIMDACGEGAELDEAALGSRLADWFGVHFRTHDVELHRYLRDRA
jgi:hemerythrin